MTKRYGAGFNRAKAADAIWLFPTAVTILLYLYALRYVVPSADDMANSVDIASRMAGGAGRAGAVWDAVRYGYMNQQGTWASSILDFFPLSFPAFRGLWALRLYLFAADILFFAGMYLFIRELMRRFCGLDRCGFSFTLIFWVAACYASPGETLYWMNGAAVYTIPFGLALISLTLYMQSAKGAGGVPEDGAERDSYAGAGRLIAASICAVTATGGNLVIGGFLCASVLCMLLAGLRTDRCPAFREWVYFAVCVIGALINTLAPGNFVRHRDYASDGGLYIGDAVWTTFAMIGNRFCRMMSEGWLIGAVAAAAAAAVCIVRAGVRVDYSGSRNSSGTAGAQEICGIAGTPARLTPIGVIIGAFGCIYAAFFPPVLAYHTSMDDPYLGIRVDYVTGWIMAAAAVFVTVYTVLWVGGRIARPAGSESVPRGRGSAVGAVIICISIGINAGYLYAHDIETYIPRFYHELSVGRLKSYYETRYAALSLLETTDETVVYLFEWLTVSHIMKDLELSYDTSWWVNQVTAAYYGKSEVSYSPPLEDYEIHSDEL